MTTTLDATCALVVTDLEKGILQMAPTQATDPVVEASARLADAFRAAGLPVVWVHATGMPAGRTQQPKPDETDMPADFTELDPRLPATDGDLHVMKDKTFSAFPRTELAAFLAGKGATQVVLTGIATGGGVESTARSAWDKGLNVTVVADACLDPNQDRHDNTLTNVIPGIGTVATVDEVLAALASR